MKKICALVLTATITTLIISCSGGRGEKLRYVAQLTEVISEKYDVEQIEIKVNNNETLTITLVNADLENSGPSEKQNMAMEIGRITMSQEKGLNFESGVVNFVQKSNYAIVTTTDSETYDMFLKKGASAHANGLFYEPER